MGEEREHKVVYLKKVRLKKRYKSIFEFFTNLLRVFKKGKRSSHIVKRHMKNHINH